MKKWLQPATALITALAGTCVMLAKCWSDTAAARDKIEESRWKRENGMVFYQDAYEDSQVDLWMLRAAVAHATNLTELQKQVKGNHP